MPIEHISFCINESPFCIWDYDLKKTNISFLNSLDPTYFSYLADVHNVQLDSKNYPASIALRISYFHALESFFTLLGAAIQSPDCVFGWILLSKPQDVRALFKKIGRHEQIINKLGIESPSFPNIASNIFKYLVFSAAPFAPCQFSYAWKHLCIDFVNDKNIDEYNSIKHGFRVRTGESVIGIGSEEKPGEICSEEKMKYEKCAYSTTILNKEMIVQKGTKLKRHFKTKQTVTTHFPSNMQAGLKLIAASFHNLITFLKIYNGDDRSKTHIYMMTTTVFTQQHGKSRQYSNTSPLLLLSITMT